MAGEAAPPSPTPARVSGKCAPGFEPVREVFEASFASGEVGAGVCIVVDGEAVVDLWGGFADSARTRAWERDTIVNTFSTTKGMTTICAHRLVDQGRLDVDAPVATYWPEFGAAGKDTLPVRYLLCHQAGLPAATAPVDSSGSAGRDRLDWDTIVNGLAAQAPAWEPGTRSQYHTTTFGYLVGEVVRRIDGRSLGNYFREEVAEPLEADFMIGFGPEHDYRCADVLPAPRTPEADTRLASFGVAADIGRGSNSRGWRAAEVPAGNGHGTAAAVARIYGALARGGEVDGVRVLSPEAIANATVRQVPRQPDGTDGPVQLPFGLGFMLLGDWMPRITGGDHGSRGFGHPGAGGSIGFADPEARLGFGYVMNQMQGGMTGGAHGWALLRAAYNCLPTEAAKHST